MSTIAWIILLILLLPMIGFLIFIVVVASLVRVPSGSLGLVMVKGRATERRCCPGRIFLPAIRRRMVEEYPSIELAYRAGVEADTQDTRAERSGPFERSGPATRFKHLDQSGPPLTVTLGDRSTATISLTTRFQLIPEQLRTVHERFGPNGIFDIVRDESSRAVVNTLGDPEFTIDTLFGPARQATEDRLATAVGAALEVDGIRVTALVLGTVDLGRTGEVIQATVRARHELEREEAEAATRVARALNDDDLEQKMTSSGEAAWRYRETDLWRDLVQRTEALTVALRAGPGAPPASIGAFDEQSLDGPSESATTS